jgi:hypothetical protein
VTISFGQHDESAEALAVLPHCSGLLPELIVGNQRPVRFIGAKHAKVGNEFAKSSIRRASMVQPPAAKQQAGAQESRAAFETPHSEYEQSQRQEKETMAALHGPDIVG